MNEMKGKQTPDQITIEETPKAEGFTAIIRPVTHEGQMTFRGEIREFGRSVTAEGLNPIDTLRELYENGQMLIDDIAEEGGKMPTFEEPGGWATCSGKLTVRMPRSLHYKLHLLAEMEGVSLNTLAVSVLTWGAERKHCEIRPEMPVNHYSFSASFANVVLPSGSKFADMDGLWQGLANAQPSVLAG